MMGDAIEVRAAHGKSQWRFNSLIDSWPRARPAQGSHEVTPPCDLSVSRYGIEASLEPSAILG